MVMKVKIAVVSPRSYSVPGTKDEQKNIEIAKWYIEAAVKEEAKLVCFPEGYPGPFCGPLSYSGPDALCEDAKKHGIYIIASELEASLPGKCYTTAWLIGPDASKGRSKWETGGGVRL